MRIRILAASVVMAAALAAPAIPAVADEGGTTPVPTVTEELGQATADAGSAPSPTLTPTATARPGDLGWG